MKIQDTNEFEEEIRVIGSKYLTQVKEDVETNPTIHCTFEDLSDVTTLHMANYNDSFKSSSRCIYPRKKHECACYFSQDSVIVYSSGGTKYIAPVSIKVLQIFPLEEGLIIQCEYNPNIIHFSLNSMENEPGSYAYLTLNSHPLNDLHPLALNIPSTMEADPIKHLIQTQVNLGKNNIFRLRLFSAASTCLVSLLTTIF